MNLNAWLDYLYHLHPQPIDLALHRVEKLANNLGLKYFPCPVVTVAGTNGKGSVVSLIENIYLAAGYQVAAYTSPHLSHFNERLRINGQAIEDQQLLDAFCRIEQARQCQSLSFFEFTTLTMLLICKQQSLNILLLEIGLGGRLDAVNVVHPDITIITNIALDHMHFLGNNRASIAREKAGIIRKNTPIIVGDPNPPSDISARAHQLHAPYYQYQQHYTTQVHASASWTWHGPETSYLNLPPCSLKRQNAATALMAIEQLQSQCPVTQFAIFQGLKQAHLPGRFEVLTHRSKTIILDVAHNPQSAEYLNEQLQQYGHQGNRLAIVGLLNDKNIHNILKSLIPSINIWYSTSLPDTPRSMNGKKITRHLKTKAIKNCYTFSSPNDAFSQALNNRIEADFIIVFGSFHTVGPIRMYLKNTEHPHGN